MLYQSELERALLLDQEMKPRLEDHPLLAPEDSGGYTSGTMKKNGEVRAAQTPCDECGQPSTGKTADGRPKCRAHLLSQKSAGNAPKGGTIADATSEAEAILSD